VVFGRACRLLVSVVAFSEIDVEHFIYYAAPLSALVGGVLLTWEIFTAITRFRSVSLSFLP